MKISAWILAFFYFFSVTGYGLEFHYCLGRVTDVNYVLLDTSCCCDDAHAALARGCCEEKEFFIQVSEDHQATHKPEIAPAVRWIASQFLPTYDRVPDLVVPVRPDERGPPLIEDFQAVHCSFVFYG